ncbi:MAG: hypothetical protein II799_01780 [Lachnospiraceae bacterium]|nr:hypothetical protein [Lachnospiraceae bacterium]
MEFENNSIEEIKYRKYSKRLVISGLAMIMLSVWSFFRFGLEVYSERYVLKGIMRRAVEQTPDMTQDDGLWILKIILFSLLIALFLSVLLHLFIGIQAIRDGLGKKNMVIYLILVVLVAQSAIASLGDSETPVATIASITEGAGKEDSEDSEDLDDSDEAFEESEDLDDSDDMFEETDDTIVNDEDTELSSGILDVTTIIICFEMLYCSIRKRILNAKLKAKLNAEQKAELKG